MSQNEFQIEAIGEVYAHALINEAQKQNALADITDDVRGIGQLLQNDKSFIAFTQAVMIGEEERIAALDKIFAGRVHPLTLSVLKSMARRIRFMFLPGLVSAFESILRKMSGRVDVELVSASELRPDVLERIRQSLGKNASTGGQVDLKVTINPALIGGMTVRIGDTLIDGSVATQLEKIEEQLKRRGVSQLQGNVAAVIA